MVLPLSHLAIEFRSPKIGRLTLVTNETVFTQVDPEELLTLFDFAFEHENERQHRQQNAVQQMIVGRFVKVRHLHNVRRVHQNVHWRALLRNGFQSHAKESVQILVDLVQNWIELSSLATEAVFADVCSFGGLRLLERRTRVSLDRLTSRFTARRSDKRSSELG